MIISLYQCSLLSAAMLLIFLEYYVHPCFTLTLIELIWVSHDFWYFGYRKYPNLVRTLI